MELKQAPAIIPALDLPIAEAGELVAKLKDVEDKIAAYKISSLHAFECGLKVAVDELRKHTELPIIYDHQKGCTDIPAITEKQVRLAKKLGVDAFIAVPLGAGGGTLSAFVNTAKEVEVLPIVLLEMTHSGANDFLKDDTPKLVFEKASALGVKYYVAPGNKPDKLKEYKAMIGDALIMSPGIGVQGGGAEEAVAAGTDYPIVGGAIYKADDPVAAVNELYEQAKRGYETR
ncbi:MAG: orotidine 5'-phosphate decarboxylase / HUMPS family protein [archaeon]